MPNISQNNLLMTPSGQLKTSQDGLVLFYDDLSATPDIVNRWLSVGANGGVAPAWSAGQINLVSGTTVNGYSLFQTRRTFFPRTPAYLYLESAVNFGNLALTGGFPANNYILFGLGTVPGTPTIAAPATDGMFWEVGLTGKLTVVTFAAGVRTPLPDMTIGIGSGASTLQIGQDTSVHRYYTYFRGDSAYASLDDIIPERNVVSQFQSGAQGPVNNTLPLTYLIISNGGASANLQLNAAVLADMGRNQLVVNNAVGTYPNAPTSIAYVATTDTAFASVNANRTQLIVSNDNTAKLYLLIDPTGAAAASATNYTYVIPGGGTFEMPNPVSTARIRGFWAAGGSAGTAQVSDISIGSTGL